MKIFNIKSFSIYSLLFLVAMVHVALGFGSAYFSDVIVQNSLPNYLYNVKSAFLLLVVLFGYYLIFQSIDSVAKHKKIIIYSLLIIFFLVSVLFFYLLSDYSPLTYFGSFLYLGIVKGFWSVSVLEQAFGSLI